MKAARYSSVRLLVSLGLLFVVTPLVEDLPKGDVIEALLLTLVMVFAVLAVGGQRKFQFIALGLLLPALAGKWINHLQPDLLHPAFFLISSTALLGFVIGRLLVFIVRTPKVDANILCAGIAGYLLLGLLWVPAYVTVAKLNPHAFNLPVTTGATATLDGFNAFYLSFATLCTVGYGDIAPVSKAARMLAVTEAITGLFYMAVLISGLVSAYSSTGLSPRSKPTE